MSLSLLQRLFVLRTASLMIAMAAVAVATYAHSISGVELSVSSPSWMRLGDDVTVSFDYQTDDAGGVRIFARPFTAGAPTPGYSASGSPVYFGSGSASGTFRINSGSPTVDSVRIRMTNADQTAIYLAFFVETEVHWGDVGISNVSIDPPAGDHLANGQQADITFDYHVPEDARIFPRPMTGPGTTPGYSASGSPLYSGAGSSSANFTIGSGTPYVDRVRFTVTNADQSVTLAVFFVPVGIQVYEHAVSNVSVDPGMVASLRQGVDRVDVDLDYYSDEPTGLRIFVRPMTNGALTPGYSAHGSPLHPTGSGSITGFFEVSSESHVDHLRIQVLNGNQSSLLYERFVPVSIGFGPDAITNVSYDLKTPALISNGSPLEVAFDYLTTTPQESRIFPRPLTDGSLTPNYGACPSPLYNGDSLGEQCAYTILSGDVRVDETRFNVVSETRGSGATRLTFKYPAGHYFGATAISSSPMIFSDGFEVGSIFAWSHSVGAP